MDVVDPHYHVWDLQKFHYPWLTTGPTETLFGSNACVRKTYLHRDYIAEGREFKVVKAVHVQAEIVRDKSLEETRWLQDCADSGVSDGVPQGIVAYCDLASAGVADDLAAHATSPNLRGIRQIVNTDGPDDPLTSPRWIEGYRQLEAFNLVFDLQAFPAQLKAAADLAEVTPGIPMIVNHCGLPFDISGETGEVWKYGMAALAACSNTAVKVSGLGMIDPDWTVQGMKPVVDYILECFGPGRVMFASNFPVDRQFSDFDTLWHRFDAMIAGCSPQERAQMFLENAERIYRL